MNFLDLAKSRYTTKKYDAAKKVSDAQIEQLKEILHLSPSSINSQPWKFTIVSDPEIKAKFAAASYFNASKINDASHLIVFSALDNLELFEKIIHEHLEEGSIAYYNSVRKPLSDVENKAWLQHQVYLALGFLLSACAAMGIDSTPMEGIETDKYDAILDQKDYKSLFAVAIGYRSEDDHNQPNQKPKTRLPLEMVIEEM